MQNRILIPKFQNLGQIAFEQGLSIYRTCDAIEGLEEGLNALRYDDHNFKDYEVIYLVMPAEETLFASMIITTV
jgi:hypothetical protein